MSSKTRGVGGGGSEDGGDESGGGEGGSGNNTVLERLEACSWLGVGEVGSRDLRRIDKGIRFVTGVGVSAGGSGESDDGGDGETGLGEEL